MDSYEVGEPAEDAGEEIKRVSFTSDALKLLAVGLVLSGLLLISRVFEPPPLADRAPGARVAVRPYTRPVGCPERTWSIGEYLPPACGHGYRYEQTRGLGLEEPPHQSGRRWAFNYLEQSWIRVRGDALAVVGTYTGWKVQAVVKDRFDGQIIQTPVDGRDHHADDYSKMPLSYAVGPLLIVLSPMVVVLAIIAVLALFPGARKFFRRDS